MQAHVAAFAAEPNSLTGDASVGDIVGPDY